MAHKTLVGGTVYDTKGGKCLVGGTAYSIKKGRTLVGGTGYDILFSNMPPIGTALNDCTWEEISAIAGAGLAPSYWAVGDRKTINIKGVVGTLNVDTTLDVYILGFDHNGSTNTIDFGTFKEGDLDVCLADEHRSAYKGDGTKAFNMNHWGSYSYGGWKGCDLRYDVLGSTDVPPSGYGAAATEGRDGYDASVNCAINPVANTLMAALPSDLRCVMKPMTVYSSSKKASYKYEIVSSVDYLPLLGEVEIFGVITMADANEANYQSQYDYYAAGNTAAKRRHSSTFPMGWWERSGANNLCMVSGNGTASSNSAGYSYGLSPIFRV